MLEKFPIFSNLSKEYLAQVEAIAQQIFVKKGSILFAPGDATQGFYAVLHGPIRVYRVSPKGKEITLKAACETNYIVTVGGALPRRRARERGRRTTRKRGGDCTH